MAQSNHILNNLLGSLLREDYLLLKPHLAEIHLRQNVVIQEANTPVTHVFFPLSGMISILATLGASQAIEIAAVGREGAVGAKLGMAPHCSFSKALVRLPGKALKIELSRFQYAASKSLAVTHIATCANEVMAINLQQSAACNALHQLESRLARWLLHCHDRSESNDIPLAQQFLSQMLGVRRSTVSVAANSLQKAAVIQYRRGKILITNRRALESISCDCYSVIKQNLSCISTAAHIAHF